jgi:NADP-dependent 3-hydroxy acid dehydrogenase YdfG
LKEIASQIKGLALQVDVRDSKAMGQAVQSLVNQWCELNIVVANVGVIADGDVVSLRDEDWQMTLDINLTVVTRTLRAAPPALTAGPKSAIVIISSVADLIGRPQGRLIAPKRQGL